jgi:cyclopropane fatty-acyl-phospholipid synthase-like methyltransferase
LESKAIASAGFREAQHKNWDAAAAGWKEWSAFNDRADAHISERLVELAGVQSGSRVLDVAAGYGEPALTAARKAGPKGRVVATAARPAQRAALWPRTSPPRCSR